MVNIRPAVVLANYFQFTATAQISSLRVESRMLLWGKHGEGVVRVNGSEYRLAPDDFLLLPWNHHIVYAPDRQRPFYVGGVHFVPDYAPGAPLQFGVAHADADPLRDDTRRRDAPFLDIAGVLCGSFHFAPALAPLAEYIVHWFQHGDRGEEEARMLGALMVAELRRAATVTLREAALPERVRALLDEVTHQCASPYTVATMADLVRCSPATLTRVFRDVLQTSPMQWLMRVRLEQAATLLMTTRLPVGDVGARVGIADPYYFSKLFKRQYGLTPSAYRQERSMLTVVKKTP
ncbi:MAG TPA: AraC family transcriptional regulator [Armatimonadota bacterium]|jgi:AraC-like DNA-binding protein